MFKWDQIESHIRFSYLRENALQIKAFSLKNTKENDVETKGHVENLVLSIKLKSISNDILGVLDVKADESYGCYLQIGIEEVSYDPGKFLRTEKTRSDTPDKSERTPMKTRPGTPLPKLRDLPSRRFNVDDDELEYKPTNDGNGGGSKVPEYVPSTTGGMDVAMIEQEYRPEPLNGLSHKNLLLYTPSSRKSVKRRKEETPSPISIPSTKKKRSDGGNVSDSQDSLADTLDNVSISGKPSTQKAKQDLFGPDSDNESKKVKKDSSFDELEKKYGVMDPPVEKKGAIPKVAQAGSSKAGFSRGSTLKPLKTKITKPKKDEDTTTVQTSMLKFTNKDSIIAEKAERVKSRRAVMRDTKTANKIAELQQKRDRIDAEREHIEQTNDFLDNQIEQQRQAVEYEEKLDFPTLTTEELEQKFEMYRNDLTKLFKHAKKYQKAPLSNINTAIFTVVDNDILDQMSDILHNNFTPKDKYEFHHFSVDQLISDFIVPEWVLMLFKDEHNLEENDARNRIRWQSNQTDQTESFMT